MSPNPDGLDPTRTANIGMICAEEDAKFLAAVNKVLDTPEDPMKTNVDEETARNISTVLRDRLTSTLQSDQLAGQNAVRDYLEILSKELGVLLPEPPLAVVCGIPILRSDFNNPDTDIREVLKARLIVGPYKACEVADAMMFPDIYDPRNPRGEGTQGAIQKVKEVPARNVSETPWTDVGRKQEG